MASPAICRSAMSASSAPAALAVLAAGLVGVALGLLLTPLLRLSGAYFAIANLAASLAVLHFVANPALEDITRGPYGVSLTGTFDPTYAYAAALVVLALTLGVVVFLKNSRFGLALQAVREDAVSASMAGVNVVRMRMIAWLASALGTSRCSIPTMSSAASSVFLRSCSPCSAASPRSRDRLSASSSFTAST